MNSLEKKLKDSAFVIGTNTSSCWVVRLSRVNEEVGVVAQKVEADIKKAEKDVELYKQKQDATDSIAEKTNFRELRFILRGYIDAKRE